MYHKQTFSPLIRITGSTLFFLFFSLIGFSACNSKQSLKPAGSGMAFDSLPVSHSLVPMINEISGIADSKVNPGYLWGEQDSHNPPFIYLIGHEGKVKKQVYIKGVTNRDWEDMALSDHQIYLGDIGDNALKYKSYFFYAFKEPSATADTVFQVDTLQFKYPDGSHNAEAFLIDAHTKDIFILTKNDTPSRIYKLSPPYRNDEIQTATQVGQLDYSTVVSACQSPDGQEIIVKTYLGLQYYKREAGQTIAAALSGNYLKLPYQVEPQGEAVTFANDNSGFFTLSEKGSANFVNLYFYKKK